MKYFKLKYLFLSVLLVVAFVGNAQNNNLVYLDPQLKVGDRFVYNIQKTTEFIASTNNKTVENDKRSIEVVKVNEDGGYLLKVTIDTVIIFPEQNIGAKWPNVEILYNTNKDCSFKSIENHEDIYQKYSDFTAQFMSNTKDEKIKMMLGMTRFLYSSESRIKDRFFEEIELIMSPVAKKMNLSDANLVNKTVTFEGGLPTANLSESITIKDKGNKAYTLEKTFKIDEKMMAVMLANLDKDENQDADMKARIKESYIDFRQISKDVYQYNLGDKLPFNIECKQTIDYSKDVKRTCTYSFNLEKK